MYKRQGKKRFDWPGKTDFSFQLISDAFNQFTDLRTRGAWQRACHYSALYEVFASKETGWKMKINKDERKINT